MDERGKSVAVSIAARLRLIAEQVKRWEARDIEDQVAAGSLKLSRPAYWLDLEHFAQMLEDAHFSVQLVPKVKAIPQNKLAHLDKDLEIAQFINAQRKEGKDGGSKRWAADAIAAAAAKYHLSEKSCERSWERLKRTVQGENPELSRYFHRLEAIGLATIKSNPNC